MTTADVSIAPLDEPTRADRATARLIAFATLAAAAAGLAAWAAAEATYDRLQPPMAMFKGGMPTAPELIAAEAVTNAGLARRAAVAFGALGGLLGVGLGAAGGLARRSSRSAVVAAVVGGALGATVAAASSWIVFQKAPRLLPPTTDELIVAMTAQGIVGGLIGAAVGSTLAAGSGRSVARGALGGLVGGAAALVLYQVIGAVALPLAATAEPVPNAPVARLSALLSLALLATLGAVVVSAPDPRRASPEPTVGGQGQ